jgi:hypothetical protein
MTENAITCKVCGLEAHELSLDRKFTLAFDIEMMEESCTERSVAAESFPCPNLHRAAMEAGSRRTPGCRRARGRQGRCTPLSRWPEEGHP